MELCKLQAPQYVQPMDEEPLTEKVWVDVCCNGCRTRCQWNYYRCMELSELQDLQPARPKDEETSKGNVARNVCCKECGI